MFSQVSVCPKGVSRPKSRGVCLPRGDVQAQAQGVCPGGCPGIVKAQAQAQGISRPRPRGVYIPAYTEADTATPPPPADGYCCIWYASYWNAFLLFVNSRCIPWRHHSYAPSCECLKIPSGTITRAEFCEKKPTYFH